MVATTDANGAFSYTGLGPGRYEVLYRVDDEVRARSGRIDLTAGAMQVSGLTVLSEPAANDMGIAEQIGNTLLVIVVAMGLLIFIGMGLSGD